MYNVHLYIFTDKKVPIKGVNLSRQSDAYTRNFTGQSFVQMVVFGAKPLALVPGLLIETVHTETRGGATILKSNLIDDFSLTFAFLNLMLCMLLGARHTFDIHAFDLQNNVYSSHYGHVKFVWCFGSARKVHVLITTPVHHRAFR